MDGHDTKSKSLMNYIRIDHQSWFSSMYGMLWYCMAPVAQCVVNCQRVPTRSLLCHVAANKN